MNDPTNIPSTNTSGLQHNDASAQFIDPITITANDAALTKLSTSQMGYYKDPFLPFLAKDAVGLTCSSISSSSSSSSSSCPASDFTPPPSCCHRVSTSSVLLDHPPLQRQTKNVQLSQSSRLPYTTSGSSTTTSSSTCTHDQDDEECSRLNGNAQDKRKDELHLTDARIRKQRGMTQMHQPVIRRGTHARVCVIDYAITNFLSLVSCGSNSGHRTNNSTEYVQIVILGSGRDTTYLRSQTKLLHHNQRSFISRSSSSKSSRRMGKVVKWYEVDHAAVIQNKYNLLCSCPLFDFTSEQVLGINNSNNSKDVSFKITPKRIVLENGSGHQETQRGGGEGGRDQKCNESITSMPVESCPPPLDPYYLISYNLLHSFQSLLQDMEQYYNFDRNVPTLFIMECLQMYLPEKNSREILQTMIGTCRYPFLAIFDPIIQNDPFGKVMAQNLAKARITDSSMSLLQTRTLKEQVDKLSQCGFTNVTGCDFYGAYEMVLTSEDRKRANRMEILDEIEEWILIMRHYCFLVGSGGNMISREDQQQEEKDEEEEEEEEEDIAMKDILRAFCSVEKGNIFGFLESKCMTRTTATSAK
jgi:O-methyltransferase involved in polyketide biosynthesis